jgi:glycosidase
MKKSSIITASLILGACVAPEVGCVQVPDEGAQPVVATHVADWRDEVIYQVLVDRYANGDVNNDYQVRPGYLARFQGGDWRGLKEHLDYAQALGVTTLWISPVIKNVETDADVDSYHGYWAQDLTQVNPHFGDLSDLRALTAEAHKRGMKVLLDIVTNHMGQVFFYDMNMNGNPDIYIGGTGQCSPGQPGCQDKSSNVTRVTEYDPDWDPRGVQAFTSLGLAGRAPIIFIQDPKINRVPPPGILGTAGAYHGFGRILNYGDEKQTELGDFPGGLKDVATELPEVRAEMIDKYTRWVELADFDGFRIDTVKHVEHDFWKAFTRGVRDRLKPQGKRNFLMFGEVFDGEIPKSEPKIGSYTKKGELDSVFYFTQHSAFVGVFANAKKDSQAGTKLFADLWNLRWDEKLGYWGREPQDDGIGIPPYKIPVNFLDNHDVGRFLFEAEGDIDALRNALTLLFTEEGIPCIYYGTEQDFNGGNDPANRDVLWKTGYNTSGDTFRHIAKLARIRKERAALRRGDTTIVWATEHTKTEQDAGIFAFERAGGDAGGEYALVVLNTSAKKTSETADGTKVMKVARPGATLVDILDPEQKTYSVAGDGTLKVAVPAQRGMILVPQ